MQPGDRHTLFLVDVDTRARRRRPVARARRDAFWVRVPSRGRAADSVAGGVVVAPMPGGVLAVRAAVDDSVNLGDPLVVMELTLVAPFDGVVSDVWVTSGDRVGVEQPLVGGAHMTQQLSMSARSGGEEFAANVAAHEALAAGCCSTSARRRDRAATSERRGGVHAPDCAI